MRERERERGAMQGRGGATTTLVFIFIPTTSQPGPAVSPNPCFYLLLIDPLALPDQLNNNNKKDFLRNLIQSRIAKYEDITQQA